MFVKTLILFLFITTTTSVFINQYIKICGLRNPKLNECLRDSFNKLHDVLFEGIPLLNVPSIRSVALSNVSYEDQQKIQIIANKSILYIFDYYITDVKLIESEKKLYFNYEIGPFRIETDFYFNGTFLIPLKGKGIVIMNSNKLTGSGLFNYKIVQKDDGQFIWIESVNTTFLKYNFDIDILPIEANNVTKGIIKTFNFYVKDNINNFTDIIIPDIEKRLSIYLAGYVNNLFKHFELKNIFPDRV